MNGLFKTGLVHLYYGDGKGKTTAVAGLASRVSGCGGKVLFSQFLKNGASGELKTLRGMSGVDVLDGKPCLKFVRDMTDAEREDAARAQCEALAEARERAFTGGYDLLVLDEAVDAAELGLIRREELLALLTDKPARLEIAVTGHRVFPELIDAADYVSEIRKVKHPYDRGVRGRRGVEF